MSHARPSEAGVTLVEALMAVFIMGLASALIVLTLPERPSALEAETKRLAAASDAARSKALVSGQWIGIQVQNGGYEPVVYRDGRWIGTSGKQHNLPRGLSLIREKVNRRDADAKANLPPLQFGPTGTAIAEPLILSDGSDEVIFSLTPSGSVLIEARDG